MIASPIGANCEVVEHGWNGYLAAPEDEWHSMLRLLIDDLDLRRRMGRLRPRGGPLALTLSRDVAALCPHPGRSSCARKPICTV